MKLWTRQLVLITLGISALVQAAYSIRSYDCPDCPEMSREPLQTHWSVKAQDLYDKPMLSKNSRSWKQQIKGRDLLQGINIDTFGPQALIRLTPLNPEGIPMQWFNSLEIDTPKNNRINIRAFGAQSDGSWLPVAEEAAQKSLLVEIDKTHGQGRFHLRLKKGIISQDSQWQLSVNDRFSSQYLHIETNKAQYRYGDTLITTVYLSDDARGFPIDTLEVLVSNPAGKSYQIDMEEIRPMVYQGRMTIKETLVTHGENWEIDVLCIQDTGHRLLTRSAHSIFSYFVPSARVASIVPTSSSEGSYQARIQTAKAARYTFQAVVYGTDAQGNTQAGQMVQSSQWLDIGYGLIPFKFDKQSMVDLNAPYYLGQMKLIDLTQLKPVFYDGRLQLLEDNV